MRGERFLGILITIGIVVTADWNIPIQFELPKLDLCADIIFLLDETDALLPRKGGVDSWNLIKEILINMTNDYVIDQERVRFSVIGFASHASVQIDPNSYSTQAELIKEIANLQLLSMDPGDSGGRNITDGFSVAGQLLQTIISLRETSPKFLVFLTFGSDNTLSTDQLFKATAPLRYFGVESYMGFVVEIPESLSDLEYMQQAESIVNATRGTPVPMLSPRGLNLMIRPVVWSRTIVESPCYEPFCQADITLLIDQSNRMNYTTYLAYVVPYLQSVVNALCSEEGFFHFGAISMCSPSETNITFDFNFPQISDAIDGRLYARPCAWNETAIETALNMTYDTLLTKNSGARSWKESNQRLSRFVVILTENMATDSSSSDGIPYAIRRLISEKHADMLAVGVGSAVPTDYLQMLTGYQAGRVTAYPAITELTEANGKLLAAYIQLLTLQNCLDPMDDSTTVGFSTVETSPPPTTVVSTSTSMEPQICMQASTSTTGSFYSSTTMSLMTTTPVAFGNTTPSISSPDMPIMGTTVRRRPFSPAGAGTNPVYASTASGGNYVQIEYRVENLELETNLTEALEELSIVAVTTTNVQNVSDGLTHLLPPGAIMNEEDVYLAVIILYNISLVNPLPDPVFVNCIQTLDVVLSQGERILRRSNFLYDTTRYVQKFIYQSIAHTSGEWLVQDTASIFINIQHIQCASEEDQKHIGAVQYQDGTVCTHGDKNESVSNADAYIQLSTDAFCRSIQSGSRQKRSTEDAYRTGSVLYRNQKLFGKEDPYSKEKVNPCQKQSWPMSPYVATMDLVPTENIVDGEVPYWSPDLAQPVAFGMNVQEQLHSQDSCSHWSTSGWISHGCKRVQGVGDIEQCQCDHLTDFTLVVDTSHGDPTLCDPSLSQFSLALSILSLIALFIALSLYSLKYLHDCLPRPLRETRLIRCVHSIRVNERQEAKRTVIEWLMTSMFLFVLLFVLLADQRNFDLSDDGCRAAAAVLYCLLLCTFLWTAFATVNYFKIFFKVFHSSLLHKIITKRVMFPVTCGVPILITVIIWLANKEFYSRDDCFCWIRPNAIYIIPGVILPLSIFIILDIILTGIIVKTIYFHNVTYMQSAAGRKKASMRNFVAIFGLQFTLGLPWILQYCTIGFATSTGVHYVFVFFNATQGFWLALLYIYSWTSTVIEQMNGTKSKSFQSNATLSSRCDQ